MEINRSFPVKVLLSDRLSEAKIREANATWEEINLVFDTGAEKLRVEGCFIHLETKGIIDHILQTIQGGTSLQQARITKRTLLPLLPSEISFDKNM